MIVRPSERPSLVDCYPCSFGQAKLYAAVAQRPDDPAFNVSMRWRVTGALGHAVLERAWNAIIARHEMLRTAFVSDGESLEGLVREKLTVKVSVVDCSALASTIVADEIAHIAAVDARASFDIALAPLWRLTRLVLSPNDSILLVTAHQLACDGWSFGLVARELGEACAAFGRGEEPNFDRMATTFGEFARWERTARTEDALAEEFALFASDFSGGAHVSIPTDFPRPAVWTSRVDTRSRVLDSVTMRRFLDEARASGHTPFVATVAVAATVLCQRTNLSAITVTTQVAGRDDVDIEKVVGPFVNSIPLRLDVTGMASLAEVLVNVGDVVANALELRHVPFAHVAERFLPELGENAGPTRGVNVLYQKAFAQDADYGEFSIVSEHSRSGGSQYDLNFYIVERPSGWRLSCDYNPDLFALETVETILDRFERVIAGGFERREPALFFHSDLFADGYYAGEVARAITQRRVIPMGPHGIGERPLLRTIDAMAADYVARIAEVQPRGPYRLLGFCAGALVAFEVARLLNERGERVEQLVLINATAPVRPILPFRDVVIRRVATNVRLSPRVREVICYNVARLNRALLRGPKETFIFVRNLLAGSRRRGAKNTGTNEGYVRSRGDTASEISFAHIGAALSHRPHRYDGEVTLIWSVDQSNLTGEATQGWNRLAKSVKTVDMSGGHVAPLHELIGELSEILKSLL